MEQQKLYLHPPIRAYSETDLDDYEAAPLRLVGSIRSKDIIRRQDALASKFVEIAYGELGHFVKDDVINFVSRSIVTRMHQREGYNGISYAYRMYKEPQLDLAPEGLSNTAIKNACVRSRNGGATPQQNDITRRVYGMGSVELSNLTVIGDFRAQLEPSMWDDISEIVGQDASPDPDEVYKLRILNFDDRDIKKAQHIGAMRIGMKRVVGYTEDGATVKARTSAIINTSPSSGFDQSILAEFRETSGSFAEMAELPSFQNAVAWLIRSELPKGLVLARNETVYEEHPDIRADIARRNELWLAA